MIELLIQNGDNIYEPVIKGPIKFVSNRKSTGKITFTVIPDGIINFQEGNLVTLKVNKINVFYGFVFIKSRNKDGFIKVTAYDQLRYLKNKDTYVYANKSADELIKIISADFNLQVGNLDDTVFKIPARIEDNKTLIDIINTALDITLQNTKKMYVLYDDFGKIALKDIESENMKLNLLYDNKTMQDLNYKSSIDSKTYDKIKLAYDNKETGKRDIYIAQDSSNINSWGVLQYFEKIKKPINAKNQADSLLELYNNKTRSLKLKKAIGDIRVIGGKSIAVSLNLGDIVTNNYMIVEKVTHSIETNNHTMDIELKGGVINA